MMHAKAKEAKLHKKREEARNTNFSQLVMPFVNDVSEVLIVELVRLISSVEATGSENG